MAKGRKKRKTRASDKTLLTLSEVSRQTGISMPTLLRYKKEHQRRLPKVGKGRTQKYPRRALAVFRAIKEENLKRRGRPRKSGKGGATAGAAKSKKKTARRPPGRPRQLLTLTEVGKRTGLSYPTLARYLKLHGDRIPSEGEGRKRRYPPRAVHVFLQIRRQTKRGRPSRKPETRSIQGAPGKKEMGLAKRVAALERGQARVSRQLERVIRLLEKPVRIELKRG
jgi:predicted DNA-binding transcriptional regulator AlpA